MILRAVFGVATLALPSACGDEHGGAGPSAPVAICDGSDELRLAARFGGGGFESPASAVPGENGSLFVYVDGTCRYWASGLWGQALSGMLDMEQEERLTSQLNVATWPSFYGKDWQGDGLDGASLVLWQPAGRIVCSEACYGRNIPEALSSIGDRLPEENQLLGDDAEPIDGPMRAYALEASIDEFPEAPFLEWTFEPPISEFSYRDDEGNVGTEPAVIDDPAAASALRAAWLETQELSEQEDFSPGFVAARDGAGVTYRVYARDVLPFEDPEGWGVELPEP